MRAFARLMLVLIAVNLSSVIWLGAAGTADPTQKAADAGTIFKKSCASCHGDDGRAKTFKAKFNGAKDLTKPEWQESVSDARIFNVITNGRKKMPPFGTKLLQAEIESLVAFVRRLRR